MAILNLATPNSRSEEEAARGVLDALDLTMAPVVLHRFKVHRAASLEDRLLGLGAYLQALNERGGRWPLRPLDTWRKHSAVMGDPQVLAARVAENLTPAPIPGSASPTDVRSNS